MSEEAQCPFFLFFFFVFSFSRYLLQFHNGAAFLNVRHVRNKLKRFLPFVHSDDTLINTFHSQLCPSLPLFYVHTHTHILIRSHYRCHGGDGGHLIVFCPGLQVLQGVEGGVVQAERVRLQRLAQRLLESFLLKLQHQPVGLLPLGLSLLCGLSPGWMEETHKEQRKIYYLL